MRASTILLAVAVIFLTAAAAATGFFVGRGSVADDHARVISGPAQTPAATSPRFTFPVPDRAATSNPRADLVLALEQPAPEGARAVRLAMNAWLAADGAAAIMAARDDPELGDAAERMIQIALHVYPELVVDNPELLEGIPEQSIAMAVSSIAMSNPDAARAIIDTHFSNSMYGDAMLAMVDQVERQDIASQPLGDPHAELESILAERGMMKRLSRLHQLVTRMAADDPAAAAELIDDLRGSLKSHAIQALVEVWSRNSPEEAARWLAKESLQVSEQGLRVLAWRWGENDFEAANAFADTLTARRREAFLNGLMNATHGMSSDEVLAWVSRYENDASYPGLITHAVQRLVQHNVDDAIELVETLPEEARGPSYGSVLSSIAYEDPEAAVDMLDDIGDESMRQQLVQLVAGIWGRNDAESALDWSLDLASGPTRDQAIASISYSLVDFDLDRAVEAIDEIEDPEVRRSPLWLLLVAMETDDEAIRLGRDHGLDRDAVLEMREQRRGMHGPGFLSPYPVSVSVPATVTEADEAE